MIPRLFLPVGLVVGTLATLPLAHGTAVTIGDSSFEGNTVTAGNWTNEIGPEWTGTGGSNTGNAFEEYIIGFVADGTDHLGMNLNFDVWQDLGVTYQANTRYTLTVAVGNRSGTTQTGNQSQYLLADSTGTVYATGVYDAAANVPSQSFANAPALVFDTPNNSASVGKTIRVLLRARGAGRSHFDNIRLDATSLIPPGGATVVNNDASAVTTGSATLNGTVTNIGNAAPSITIFWGPADGGLTPGNWAHSVNLSGTYSGAFSTGLSGLDPATTYFYTARATNSAGDSWAQPALSFETTPLPPTVTTEAATATTSSGATLHAHVSSTGGEAPTVMIYYGLTDGGTNTLAWEHSVSLGTVSTAGSAAVTGLTMGTTYHFRAHASNSGGSAWAPASLTFDTLFVTPPDVENRSAAGITGTSASLRGEVTDDGNETPTVTVFYGTTDGGTNPGAWDTSAAVGLQGGEFTRFVSGLSPTTTYYFRCRAVNAAGTSWAPTTASFLTTTLVPNTAVINEFHYKPLDDTSLEEFIELHNPGDSALDLSGWTLAGAVSFTFPPSTTLSAGGYLLVAENPAVILSKFGKTALGPWVGKLNSTGETILLQDAGGATRDSVSYQAGFPWPTNADGNGSSCELINPTLDNDLGGSWRASAAGGVSATTYITAAATGWKYFKGTAEPTPSDVTAWRAAAFNDGTWLTGQTPIGIGGSITNHTVLSDMYNSGSGQLSYRTAYGRKTFTVAANQIPDVLTLRLFIDDGCVVWINGTEVYRNNVGSGQLAYDATSTANVGTPSWTTINLTGASNYLLGGTNVLAIHAINSNSNRSNRSDFTFDAELSTTGTASIDPTPGAANSVFKTSNLIAPQIRQVEHTPKQPASGQPVVVTAKITDLDPIGTVTLAYQTVDPGSYIRKTDAAYSTSWTSVAMHDDGLNGDATAGDYIFSVTLPGTLQTNRRLVRYKITFADTSANSQTVPYADDEQPNFAYYVYDGLPAWSGSFRPGSNPVQTFPATLLDDLPVYTLVANGTDVINSQYNGGYDTVQFYGTFVYDGVVYDHIQFKNRGEASTYVSGKNKWRFFFNRSRDLPARDTLGRPYAETWGSFSADACASPWAAVHRGSAGVEEAVSYKIFQVAGMPSPNLHYYHFRVVRGATETPAAGTTISDPLATADGQFLGDFWGLYQAIEPVKGSFLDERGLPDGNVYKIEGNAGDKKHQCATQPVDSSDWNTFRDTTNNTTPSEAWWRANMDMEDYYTFHALNRLTGNVDVRSGYNHMFYHRSSDNRWVVIPWDLDMMFIAETHWSGIIDQNKAITSYPSTLGMEYKNRAREILDLMASDNTTNGGQIGQLIDEFAQIVNPTGQTLTWADADAAMWNLHPKTQGSDGAHNGQTNHKGNFFYTPFTDERIGGNYVRWLRNQSYTGVAEHEDLMVFFRDYATNTWPGGTWTVGNGNQLGYGYQYLLSDSADTDIPTTPTLTYSGSPGYPANNLVFTSSAFGDPQGAGTFGAMQWRLAEIAAPGKAGWTAGTDRKYELQTTWTSGELASFSPTVQVPGTSIQSGHTYRVRVRHKDNTGRWSHWSAPVEFSAAAADVSVWQQNLVVSEINYHPLPPATPAEEAAAGGADLKNEFEFIELRNISSSVTLDLAPLAFTKGITYSFSSASITSLAPGGYVLVVKNQAAFQARYGTGLPVAGVYTGSLDNAGEEIILSRDGTAIRDFTYDDSAPWPTSPDGSGPTLVLKSPLSNPDHNVAANWRASFVTGGSPGTVDNLASVDLLDLAQAYDGTAKAATAVTSPVGLSVSLTYNGNGAAPVDAGSYAVVAMVTDPDYEGGASGTLVVSKAPQNISFNPPASAPLDGPSVILAGSATSGLDVTFSVITGPGSLAGNTLSFTGGGDVTVRATQTGDTNHEAATPVDRVITVTTSWQGSDWRATHFTPTELAQPTVSGDTADPDGDGLVNLVEYALKLDPKTRDVPSPIVVSIVTDGGQDFHAFTFRRRVPNVEITYTPEITDDLTSWRYAGGDLVLFGAPLTNPDGTETVTYRSTAPAATATSEYFRLRVSLP